MNVGEAVSRVKDSAVFKNFIDSNPNFYLVHAFTMIVDDGRTNWDVGFYSKDSDRMVVFQVGSNVKIAPEQEVFKQKKVVEKLDLDKVDLEWDEALDIALKEKIENHGKGRVSKKILILQTIDKKQVYNITLITDSFNIINVRVDAADGKVVSQSKSSIMNLGKKVL